MAARLAAEEQLPREELICLIACRDEEVRSALRTAAEAVRKKYYGTDVYIRGLIEISNYCRNDCLYCGIRRSNAAAQRYRLTKEEILACCEIGYELGFRTFVLQGGEDGGYTDAFLEDLILEQKRRYPDCAVTLSLGERSRESYERLRAAGADRYLLRQEAADPVLYGRLHPREMSLENRIRCLWDLKEIGYQVGCGFMVGAPGQTPEHIAADLEFMKKLKPQMIGIGPYVPHRDTPFAGEPAGSLEQTLMLLSVLRLMFPSVLLPATTALGTIAKNGRELGICSGANVVMPNLSPQYAKDKYMLYNNKLRSGAEAAEGLAMLRQSMEAVGYQIVTDRGDCAGWTNGEETN